MDSNNTVVADEVSQSSQGGSVWDGNMEGLSCIPSWREIDKILKKNDADIAEMEKSKAALANAKSFLEKEKSELDKNISKEKKQQMANTKVAEMVASKATITRKEIGLNNEYNVLSKKISSAKEEQKESQSKLLDFKSAHTRMTSDLHEYFITRIADNMASENTNVATDEGGSIDLGYLETLARIPPLGNEVALFLKNKNAYLAELEKCETDLAKEKSELTKELTKEKLAKAKVADLV